MGEHLLTFDLDIFPLNSCMHAFGCWFNSNVVEIDGVTVYFMCLLLTSNVDVILC